ncbi:hypothetical protein AV274_6433 [Blastocystis sp. ATCC 50177/Nand II]|uniref:EH domain-containing protein n=1 Tax=Blastocystis sp. subtype 1 (strain ATCC 50177 / NandII) TaxID=478820 RepID=A0A196S460_BLAHN|nr:hypothetical protein AV274_6433 [Blastocystis sp. ATCC 50177/Nand II]
MSESLLNKQEVLYYDAVFASLTEGKEDVIRGKEAVSMLRQSELSSDEIKSIWVSVVGNGVMEIDKEHFRLVMRLIALVQEGYPAESDSLRKYANKPVQFAELKGIQPFVVINRSLNKEAMRAYSELASADVLPGKQAISYLLSLGMEKDELKRIWKFVDYDASLEVNSDQWWLKKITLLWTRVATHTLAFVHEGATTVPLKALITQLRQRDVDLDALKAAARALLDENPNLESVSVPQTIRLLVLLNDPSTPTQAPLAASDLPTVPGDAEFFTQAQQALKRIREEVDALRKAGQGAPQLFGSTEDPRKERGFFENIKELFEAQLRKGDLRDIEQLAGFLDVFAEIKRKMQARAPVEEVRALQKTVPTPNAILQRFRERPAVPDVLAGLRSRLEACDPSYREFCMSLLPEDPVVYVEMNDVAAYVALIEKLEYYVSVVEVASVRENANIIQYWTNLMMSCKKVVEECVEWAKKVEEDIRVDVMREEKVRQMMTDAMLAVRVAQRINDCMVIVGNEIEGCFDSTEKMYTDMLNEFNEAQDEDKRIVYKRLVFDLKKRERCELCLHASDEDRPLASHIGRKYHPECANLWISRIDKSIPVYVSKEDSFY